MFEAITESNGKKVIITNIDIPEGPDNLSEFNGNVSLSLLGAPSKTIDFCLKVQTI